MNEKQTVFDTLEFIVGESVEVVQNLMRWISIRFRGLNYRRCFFVFSFCLLSLHSVLLPNQVCLAASISSVTGDHHHSTLNDPSSRAGEVASTMTSEHVDSRVLFQKAEGLKIGIDGVTKDLERARALYQKVAGMKQSPYAAAALNALAELFLFSQSDLSPHDFSEAISLFNASAAAGNPRAHFMMGVFHSTGLFRVAVNQAKALLHFHFSAIGNDTRGTMAAGYRNHFGIGVPRNCQRAVVYYELAANVVIDTADKKGVTEMNEQKSLSDTALKSSSQQTRDEDILQYFQYAADKGELRGLIGLGQLYYYGLRGVSRNFNKAFDLFQKASKLDKTNGAAFANMGNMFLYGFAPATDGVAAGEPNYAMALSMFDEAVALGSSFGNSGLGAMYLWGMGVPQDVKVALEHLKKASEAGNADAHYNLGVLYLGMVISGTEGYRNFRSAAQHFTVAANAGHLHGKHKLAHMYLHGMGIEKDCKQAAMLFKSVAESGEQSAALQRALKSVDSGKVSKAMVVYSMAAEMGFQRAQENAAWLYEEIISDSDAGILGLAPNNRIPAEAYSSATNDQRSNVGHGQRKDGTLPLRAQFGLRMWQHAASQGNVYAHLRVGDIFFNGYQSVKIDYAMAAVHYQKAASLGSAQAMYNLGYMHHHGFGHKDFHLAKRHYDTAINKDRNAYFPCMLALHHLFLQSAWETAVDWREFLSAIYQTFNAYWIKGITFELFLGSKPL